MHGLFFVVLSSIKNIFSYFSIILRVLCMYLILNRFRICVCLFTLAAFVCVMAPLSSLRCSEKMEMTTMKFFCDSIRVCTKVKLLSCLVLSPIRFFALFSWNVPLTGQYCTTPLYFFEIPYNSLQSAIKLFPTFYLFFKWCQLISLSCIFQASLCPHLYSCSS